MFIYLSKKSLRRRFDVVLEYIDFCATLHVHMRTTQSMINGRKRVFFHLLMVLG